MKIIESLLYTKNHEWVRVEGEEAYIGITDYAQEALGDIVFLELPSVGDTISINDEIGVIESVKAASELYAPVSGTVTAINGELLDAAEGLNTDPYGEAWLFHLELSNKDELDSLMSASDYEVFCQT